MCRNFRKKPHNIAQKVKRILTILFLVLVVYAGCSAALLRRAAQQTLREIEQISSLYTNELDDQLLRISRRLFSVIMEKNKPDSFFWYYTEMIRNKEPEADFAVRKLRENTLSYMWEYGTEFSFFIYLENSGQYFPLSLSDNGDYREVPEEKRMILKQIQKIRNTTYSVKKRWNTISAGEETYICKIAKNQDVYLGCYANIKSILEPYSGIVLGDQGYVRLVDDAGRTVSELTQDGISDRGSDKSGDSHYSIRQDLSRAPFHIQMGISNRAVMKVSMGSMLLLLGGAAALIIAGAAILIYLKYNMVAPIQRFASRLEVYDQGGYALEMTQGNLQELEQIDSKFHKMIRQIQKLKITLYENELLKQKMEMEYLNLQIRPHFYLNCLNFIYSMIDFGQYQAAKQMAQITAGYLRYIFRCDRAHVPVSAETQHCRDYLDILLLRYPKKFEYYIEVHEEVADALIFPFLIQVFVENSAKQMLTLDRHILISVTVYPEDREEGKYVNIYISDTGNGFPEDILRQLQENGEPDKKDGHIGISNCLRRFRNSYGETGEIFFSNSPLGGAVVDIHLPYTPQSEVTDESFDN